MTEAVLKSSSFASVCRTRIETVLAVGTSYRPEKSNVRFRYQGHTSMNIRSSAAVSVCSVGMSSLRQNKQLSNLLKSDFLPVSRHKNLIQHHWSYCRYTSNCGNLWRDNTAIFADKISVVIFSLKKVPLRQKSILGEDYSIRPDWAKVSFFIPDYAWA